MAKNFLPFILRVFETKWLVSNQRRKGALLARRTITTELEAKIQSLVDRSRRRARGFYGGAGH
jgi:hypothetical protein